MMIGIIRLYLIALYQFLLFLFSFMGDLTVEKHDDWNNRFLPFYFYSFFRKLTSSSFLGVVRLSII